MSKYKNGVRIVNNRELWIDTNNGIRKLKVHRKGSKKVTIKYTGPSGWGAKKTINLNKKSIPFLISVLEEIQKEIDVENIVES